MSIAQIEVFPVTNSIMPSRILFFEEKVDYALALEKMIKTFSPENMAAISTAIHKREQMGSTAINLEIAFPHARIEGLSQIKSALGICPKGITNGSIRLIYLFITPAQDTRNHLRFLTSAASLFLTDHVVDQLAMLQTPEAILEKTREIEYAKYSKE